MMAVAFVFATSILVSGHGKLSAGFALGAGLAIVNYYWLHEAIQSLFDSKRAGIPKAVVAKFAVRYPLAFATVYLFYRTGWLPFGAVLVGLFVPVAGALIEAGFQIREVLREGAALGNEPSADGSQIDARRAGH